MNRPPFALSREERQGVAVLTVSGDIDVDTAWELREALTETLGERDTVVDMSGVEFLDSTGLGVLVAGYRQARNGERRMAIAGAPRRVLDILELTRLMTIFALYPTVDEAVEGLTDAARSS